MLRFSDIVFGPIRSRRLGSSLGINLLPADGKLCNFDCIYCECGWNRDGHSLSKSLPTADDVREALESRLKQCAAEGVQVDSITFSGNGEPTMHILFPEIIDLTIELRDRYFPSAKISVLSNATTLGRPGVMDALKKVDNPILKIDAPTDEAAALINRPAVSYSVDEVVERLKGFDGNFVLQTMFLSGEGFDSADSAGVEAWRNIVRTLKPREVMVYTIDRETPSKNLRRFSREEMEELTGPLAAEGFKIQISA